LSGPDSTSFSSVFLSTAALPARDRLPVWREVFGQTMVRLDIEPLNKSDFHAEGELCALPGVAFASVTAAPFRVARTQKLIAADNEDMAFLVTADAPLRVAQRGRERMLDAGDAIFIRGGERSVIESGSRATLTNVAVPVDALTPMLADDADLSLATVSRHSDMLDLLLGYVRLLQARKQPMPDGFAAIAATHVRDLMVAALGAEAAGAVCVDERGGVRAARLRAIKADIGRHFREPGLSIDDVAVRHGISPRYVRKLLHEAQTTFSDFLLELRLEQARRLLRSPEHATSTIAAIAYAAGFSDLSYFNRTFRRRHGATPSALRRDVRQ
jgi:AraC-like DNA-binding protein